MTEHGNQRIQAESVDLAPDQVADSGLADAQKGRRLHLREAAALPSPRPQVKWRARAALAATSIWR